MSYCGRPTIEGSPAEIYDIELEHSLLEPNAKLARENRAVLDQHGTTAIDFMGAIGSGKTTLTENLKSRIGIAVFNGDATVSTDVDPIASQGVPMVQLASMTPGRLFDVKEIDTQEPAACISGLVLKVVKKPHDCPAFGTQCTPDHPLGATMVSAEGACAAYYAYARHLQSLMRA